MFSMKTWSTLLVAILIINYCNGASVSIEQAAKDELKSYDLEISKIRNDIIEAVKTQNTTAVTPAVNHLRQLNYELANSLRKYDWNSFQVEMLKRQINNILNAQFKMLIYPSGLTEIYRLQESLNELATNIDNCKYNDPHICNLPYIPTIKSILHKSHDPIELQYYWKQWRDKNWVYPKSHLYKKLIIMMRNSAEERGLSLPSHGWYSSYENINFIQEMERVMSELAEFYKEFHGYVRHVLNQKYGDFIVSKTGPIPQHLLEQVLDQAWDEDSLLKAPFPKKKLPNLKANLKDHNYDGAKLVQISAQFFYSMGFTRLNDTMMNSFVKQKTPKEAGEDCNPEIDPITVQIKYCPKANFKQFLQLHGYMSQAEYRILTRNLPIGLRDEACPGFSNAIGEAVILSASTPKHIERVDILADYHYDNELSLNRLFRLGLHTMFQIPTYYVHDKFIIDSLNNRLELSQPNCHYWTLMDQYAGVEPPLARHKNLLDVSHKFYEDIFDNHQTKKFISEIVGYQIYRGLCEKSGQYVPNDPLRPLQNCDFYDSLTVGTILKDAMSLGQSKPWKAVLKDITGDETISARGLLEFYDPLYKWLKEQNAINKVETGWTISTKCS